MSIGKIGASSITNIMPDVTTAQKTVKKQDSTPQETYRGDVVSIAKNEVANNATKLNYPPLFPLGDTQGIFKLNE
jgi:hypothetical protein